MRSLRWGPPAFVISVAALVMSLGGTGYALTQASDSHAGHQSAASRAGYTSATGIALLPAWHPLTLTGGWTYGGFDSYHAAYYKDSGNVVHLRGSAKSGNTQAAVFRLPRSARPSHILWLPVYAFQGSAGGLEILPNGQAFLFDNNSGINVTGYSSFDGITFRVP